MKEKEWQKKERKIKMGEGGKIIEEGKGKGAKKENKKE